MKVFISLILVVVAGMPALADCQQEAQFIGQVYDFNKTKVDQNIFDCTYKISYRTFNESVVCPFDYGVAIQHVFDDASCSLNNGDIVSGVLVKDKNEYIYIE